MLLSLSFSKFLFHNNVGDQSLTEDRTSGNGKYFFKYK